MPQLSPTMGFLFFICVLISFLVLMIKLRGSEARASRTTSSKKSFKEWMF